MRRLLAAAATLALAACMVGPDYRSPLPQAPAQDPFLSGRSPAFTGEQPPGRWWSLFADPVLDRLIEQALAANTDLRVAAANLRRARAVLRETRSGLFPTAEASASATYSRQSGDQLGFEGAGGEGWTYDAGIDASYQVDLFGRIRRAIQAARADAGAAQAAFDLSRITVAAETARAYADACSAGRQLAVARDTLAIQEQTFDLTRRLLEGGRATALETGQAGALLEQVRATVPTLEAQRQTALFRLSVLTGRPPAEFPREVAACETSPAVARPIPVGDGASLLSRRPDVRQAERELAAATARVGVAVASLYPTITLGGSAGSSATSLGGLGSSDSFRFSIGPLISWSFTNLAVGRARVIQAEANAEGSLARFEGTWLRALEETESALTRYARELDRREALRRGRAQAAEAARIARLRYGAGRDSFQIVLDAERSLADMDAALAQSEAQLSDNLVSLFLALGGGW
ncbi:MAG: TolC family protein [Pseudomonadota bacterium]|nr:TolC family protein [Pseudomonadota bacterium]